MMQANNRFRAWPLALALTALVACDGRTSDTVGEQGGNPALQSVEIGRLVDIYSFRRIDPAIGDRRLRSNRELELIARDVVVNPGIETQSIFDAAGNEVVSANYEFLPFDKGVGHEQLVVLWDDRPGPESQNFTDAFADAQTGLISLPDSYRGQNTQTRPIPIVPRNAAIKLNFTGSIGATSEFFDANPAAVQLLEFQGDPNFVQPVDAFRILPYRMVVGEDSLVLDTTILGGEAGGGITSAGMPTSSDNVTANIRVAIPDRGQVLSSFYVDRDGVNELNGVDSAGRNAVIRDFRSGNLLDGPAGRLLEPEAPKLIGSLGMGILSIDPVNNILTVDKRLNLVPIRARYPFVDGPVDGQGLPLGPLSVPAQRPLSAGDLITQDVIVQTSSGLFETVTIRAEVLENLSIDAAAGSASVGKAPNAPAGDSGQGETVPVVQLRVATVSPGRDSEGNRVSFVASSSAGGEDCTLRAVYVEEVPYSIGGGALSDVAWRNLFVRIEPAPGLAGVDIDPNASVAFEFNKPMDLDQVDVTGNLLLTKPDNPAQSFAEQMTDPKQATLHVVPARLTDLSGDGTVLRLQPQLGFAHAAGTAEVYSAHILLDAGGITDLAGNTLEIFDDIGNPQQAWSVDFQLDPSANSNLIGWHSYMFNAEDEDGSLPGSVDIFGQYRIENGRLTGASGVRFQRSANNNNLAEVSRINRGECWDSGEPDGGNNPSGIWTNSSIAGLENLAYGGSEATENTLVLPTPGFGCVPTDTQGAPHPGLLYWEPRMSDEVPANAVPQVYEYAGTLPQPSGRVIEPMKPQGSRMQMRYIEDDFSLGYTQPSDFGLDIEQLYWSPFNDETVLYDEFDRFTMSLGHARKRADENWFGVLDDGDPPAFVCILDGRSMNSGLSNVFSDNVLDGTEMVPVFEDRIYTINPNEVSRDAFGVASVPFPRFDTSYTWRDSRLITVDSSGNVIGLGGAQNPNGQAPGDDVTANIDSPWITSVPDAEFQQFGSGTWVMDPEDFDGLNQRDHDPIALPLLVDMKMFPEDPANGIASATNGFQVAMLGPPSVGNSIGGYYDTFPSGCPGGYPPWPRLRVHASGGFDLITGGEILVDPANVLQANAVNIVKDPALGDATTGLFQAPPGDGMLYWARADFVRRVSTVTFGFFDTLQPQRAELVDPNQQPVPTNGYPDWASVNPNLRMSDVLVQLDPPQTRQPAGTGVYVELRGCETFENSETLYNPQFGAGADDSLARGNLLNVNYACEAYRYASPNYRFTGQTPRIAADGLTPYVTEDAVSQIRDPASGLFPRFLNLRLVMTNNVDVTPAVSPSLRSMSVVYRLTPGQ
ncbi:MAG: hypothetical protein VXY92_04630 [Planctomycetota bacterium]|nr:hypothetical protein [Planctomycetota bacterium]